MVYCVGLTGSIASGKTQAAELFSKYAIEIIDADQISKELTQKDQPMYQKIVAHYGLHILNQNAAINRNTLRDIIFSNPNQREWLEQLLHPLIRQEIKKRVHASTASYCMVEIPLLITKHAYPYINRILLVTAPIDMQLARLMKRDQCSKAAAEAILFHQPDNKLRLENTDDVLVNNWGFEELAQAVSKLHDQYLQTSKNSFLDLNQDLSYLIE